MSALAIPSSVSGIHAEFDVSVSREESYFKYDFLFNTAGDEMREKLFRTESFVDSPGRGCISQKLEEDSIAYAKAMIKVNLSLQEL